MTNISQISERLAAYLNKRTTIDAFEDWIISNTWNIHLTGNSELMDLVYDVQDLMNEHSLLHIDEDRLKEKLKQVLYSIKPSNVIVIDLVRAPSQFLPIWQSTALSPASESAVVGGYQPKTVQV